MLEDSIPSCPVGMTSEYMELRLHHQVLLYRGPMMLHGGSSALQGRGRVFMAFLPSPGIRFSMSVRGHAASLVGLEGTTVELPVLGCSAPAMVLGTRVTSSGTATAEGVLCGSLVAGARTPGRCVRFHVVNLSDYVGAKLWNGQQTGNGLQLWCGRAELRFGPWVAVLDAPSGGSKRWEDARAARGYALTHVGELRRQDGATFTFDDASTAFEFLHWALSFANGAQCDCVLRKGLSDAGEMVWDEWGAGRVAPAAFRQRWITDRPLGSSFDFTLGMFDLWCDTESREWLQTAIGLYTSANCESTREIGLITAQTALELLISVVLERPGAALTGAAFERIRLLLGRCGVPLRVPPELEDIHRTFPPSDPVDGPQAATRIRNRFAHPTEENRRKARQIVGHATYEAVQLTLWYVEMVLLRQFGYRGQHCNRAKKPQWAGARELVPWA